MGGILTMFSMMKSKERRRSSAMKKIGIGILAAGVTTAVVYGVRAYFRWRSNHSEDERADALE
jgi:hypothetical protein